MYVIPIVIGVVLLFAGLPLSAWYTNQPVRTIVTWAGIKDVLFAKVSAWTDIVLLLALTAVGYLLYRTYERYKEVHRESDARHAANLTLVSTMQEKDREHRATLQTIQNNGPKIHVAWNKAQDYLGPRRGWDGAMYADWWMGTHQRQRCLRGNPDYRCVCRRHRIEGNDARQSAP